MHRISQRILLLTAICGLALAACETSGLKKRASDRTIDRQGIQAIAVLGGYLFPRGWDEAMQVSVARRMFPLEYHGNQSGGKVLIQSKVEFDTGALQRLLSDVQRTTRTFTTSAGADHPFSKEARQTESGGAANRPLDWWKPDKHKDPKFYFWRTNRPGEPATRVWLQVTDDKRNVKLVFIRIESE